MIDNKNLIKSLRRSQHKHLMQAILKLEQYTIYSVIDSSLAVPGEIDSVIKQLTELAQEEVKNGWRGRNGREKKKFNI